MAPRIKHVVTHRITFILKLEETVSFLHDSFEFISNSWGVTSSFSSENSIGHGWICHGSTLNNRNSNTKHQDSVKPPNLTGIFIQLIIMKKFFMFVNRTAANQLRRQSNKLDFNLKTLVTPKIIIVLEETNQNRTKTHQFSMLQQGHQQAWSQPAVIITCSSKNDDDLKFSFSLWRFKFHWCPALPTPYTGSQESSLDDFAEWESLMSHLHKQTCKV